MTNSAPAATVAADCVLLTERRGRVLVITLNRPQVRNAFNVELAESVERAMDELDDDPDLWVGILTGAGGCLSAGADLQALEPGRAPTTAKRGHFGVLSRRPDKTLIAAVEGFAVAGGFELVLACDLVVAAQGARFGIPEVRSSLVAVGGGLVRLPRAVPHHIAMELALTGASKTAEELHAFGLVNRICEPGSALTVALELADQICANGPIAVTASRRILRRSATGTTEADLLAYQDVEAPLEAILKTQDAQEGIAAFRQKRTPVWKNK